MICFLSHWTIVEILSTSVRVRDGPIVVVASNSATTSTFGFACMSGGGGSDFFCRLLAILSAMNPAIGFKLDSTLCRTLERKAWKSDLTGLIGGCPPPVFLSTLRYCTCTYCTA